MTSRGGAGVEAPAGNVTFSPPFRKPMKFTAPIALVCVSVLLCPRPAAAQDAAKAHRPIRALLVIGGCCHDYAAQQKILTEGVSARANVEWTISYDPDKGTKHKNPVYGSEDWAKGFDVIVHDECTAGVTDVPFIEQRVLKPHRDGIPAVILHCAEHSYRSEGFPKDTPWFQLTGVGSTGHGPQLPIEVTYVDPEHPITKGLANWTTINEELYNNVRVYDTARPLARGKQKVRDRRTGAERVDDFVVAWTNLYNGKTRVFATTLGHNNQTVGDAKYLDLVTRGLLWSVDKLDENHLKPAAKVLSHGPAAATAPRGAVPENLAFGKPATASSAQDEGRSARFAFDGDEISRWCAAGDAAPQWLRVDLGRPEELTGARVKWEFDGREYRHKLEGSPDGTTWSVLVDRTGKPAGTEVEAAKFSAKGIRHVRLTVTGLSPGAWASLYELEVFGTRMVEPAVRKTDGRAAAARIAASLKAPEGFELTVFAAPPDVNYPTVVAATPTGELFVGIDEMGSLGRKEGRGRVMRCADRDGDGVAEEFKTFAAMDHPRGIVWDASRNKLYVQHPPYLTVYTDDDGDGDADSSEVLVRGTTNERIQTERGADHTTNGMRLGIDGWLYIAMGDFGCTKAVGKDGAELTMHGGGVVRVRTDGSGLEAYTFGQRNIYDVAIDPLMNAFTRDNTNDGDGWDVRLSHVVPTADYGYPRLFKNFPDEIVKPMMELGGGSPCGALYVQEPGLPPGCGDTLFTVEWGRNAIMRHHLTPKGAGFVAAEEKWMDLPRGTDVDVDASGRFYISSWAGGGFDYSGPDVGYVVRLSPKGAKALAAPDLYRADAEGRVGHLGSPSAVLRLAAQRQIVDTGVGAGAYSALLKKMAASDAPIEARAAAVFALAQFNDVNVDADLLPVAARDDLREFVLRAVADRKDVARTPAGPFAQALEDKNPRVRLQAARGLGRIGAAQSADALVARVADEDPLVAHVAVNSLVSLRAYDACIKAVDASTPQLVAGAARALQGMHETRVVELLAEKLATQQDAAVRSAVYRALCRLAYREASWDGGWWGTRPDTSGPFYKLEEWEGTARVKEVLRGALASERPELLRTLVVELKRHKIDLPEAAPVVAKLAASDPTFRQVLVDLLGSKSDLSPDDVALVRPIALSATESESVRAKAVRLLARKVDSDVALGAVVEVLAPIAAAEPAAGDLASAFADITRDQRLARRTDYFTKLSAGDDAARRELAFVVLLNVANSPGERGQGRARARKTIDAAWAHEASATSLLRAIGRSRTTGFNDKVVALKADARPAVAEAAAGAAQRLGLAGGSASATGGPSVMALGYDKSLAAVTIAKGDAGKGAETFTRLACANCHTVSATEAPKGPFLGGISARYNRSELCESILKPSEKIAQGFETQWFKPALGDVVEGFVTRESGDEVELRNVQGETVVLKKQSVQRRGKRDFSTMPEGLASNLTPEELADLLAYVESLKGQQP